MVKGTAEHMAKKKSKPPMVNIKRSMLKTEQNRAKHPNVTTIKPYQET